MLILLFLTTNPISKFEAFQSLHSCLPYEVRFSIVEQKSKKYFLSLLGSPCMKASFTRRLRSLAQFSADTGGLPSAAARATISGKAKLVIRCSSVRKSCTVSFKALYFLVVNLSLCDPRRSGFTYLFSYVLILRVLIRSEVSASSTFCRVASGNWSKMTKLFLSDVDANRDICSLHLLQRVQYSCVVGS